MLHLIYDASISQFYENIRSDLKYAGLLLVCVGLSTGFRLYVPSNVRVKVDGLLGLAITIFVAQWTALYSLIAVVAHLVLYKLVRDAKLLGQISFFGTFLYLGLLRVVHFAGPPKLEFITNAIQLIMTLRIIGLSYEIADTRSRSASPLKKIVEPTTLAAFNYLYSYTGIFTGPYYSYRTYHDAYLANFNVHVPLANLVMPKLATLAWSLPLLVIMNIIAPVKILQQEESGDYHVLHLFLLSALAFVYLRMRIYSAWMVAESICVISGIGIYPTSQHSDPGNGPKRTFEEATQAVGRTKALEQYDCATIENLDIARVESSDGFRSGMRAWNKSVQYWLANFVYRRSTKSIRMPWTMFVSAFWHGVHPGYFLSFLTIPLCTAAEDILFKCFPANAATADRNWIFSIVWRFVRMRGFEAMACGFLLLTWSDTMRLWTSTYLWLHVTMLTIIVLHVAGILKPRRHVTTLADTRDVAPLKSPIDASASADSCPAVDKKDD